MAYPCPRSLDAASQLIVRSAVVKRSMPLLDEAAVPVVMTVTANFTQQASPNIAARVASPAAGMIRLTVWRGPAGLTTAWDITTERAAKLPRWNPSVVLPRAIREVKPNYTPDALRQKIIVLGK